MWIVRVFVVVVAFGVSIAVQAQDVDPEALTNEDVVRMVEADLGDALIIAKVESAAQVDFQTSVDDIIALKERGISEAVIEALVKRQESPVAPPSPAPEASTVAMDAANPYGQLGEELGLETIRVALETAEEGQQRIRPLKGEFSTVAMGTMAFFDFPGLDARVRTKSRRPSLLVKSAAPLTGGKYFFATLDRDVDDGIRSLKVSSVKGRFKTMFGNSRSFMEPDEDWTLPYAVEDLGNDMWRVTLEQDLEPGEYGWYVDINAGPQQSTIFDFGVD